MYRLDKTTNKIQFILMLDMMSKPTGYFMLQISPLFKSIIHHGECSLMI